MLSLLFSNFLIRNSHFLYIFPPICVIMIKILLKGDSYGSFH